jgi:hypothetical protein
VPILSLIAGQTWLVATTGPTVEHAQTLAAAGQHEPARREAQAVVELGVEAPRARVIHDDEQLELIRALREPRLLWQLASQSTFLTGDGRKRAEAIALRRTLDVAGDLLRTNDFQRSLSTLEMIPTAYRRTSEVSERAITVRTAAIEPLWRTISSNEPSRVRLAACGPAELLLKELATRGTTPDTARRVQATCASLTAGELERVRREQKAAKLAALKARQREGTEARRREQVARSRALAPLLCRDGSLSPTCICGGSRRGCCSHHGGVAGCS